MEQQLTTITRSYSYKRNMGNYESRDYFCSQGLECKLEDADRVSDALYDFCKKQVIKSVQSDSK